VDDRKHRLTVLESLNEKLRASGEYELKPSLPLSSLTSVPHPKANLTVEEAQLFIELNLPKFT